jgi:hypothetical protein
MANSIELRGRIQEVADQLRRAFYGGRGAPISGEILFEELEEDACQLGDAIARELMQQVLQAQAEDDHPETRCECSVCRRDGKLDEVKPRVVQTRRGEVTWREPRYFCKHCRKAFFPSREGLGD